jgi:ERCC4-type nuclease
MAVGDIQIGTLLIERKTIKDLEASVLDGRYREQKTRLLTQCQEKGFSPLYILEGPFSSTTGRLQVPALMKLVARLQYKHGIPVIHTASLEETAPLIKALAEYYVEDPTNFVRTTEPLRQFMMAALAQCPGISVKMAEAIHTAFPTWTALMAADEKGIEMIVQGNGRRIGPAVAKRLFTLLHS